LLRRATSNLNAEEIASVLSAGPTGLPAFIGYSTSPAIERASFLRAALLCTNHVDNPDHLLALVAPSDTLTRAAILIRAKKFDTAGQELSGKSDVEALLYLALAEHGRGNPAAARQALDLAKRWLDAPVAVGAKQSNGDRLSWPVRASVARLRAEAETLPGGKRGQ
jgi:hypothetical protein